MRRPPAPGPAESPPAEQIRSVGVTFARRRLSRRLILAFERRSGGTGRRRGLKIPRPQGCVGSTPTFGTTQMADAARVIQVGDALPSIRLRSASGEDIDLTAWQGRLLVLVCVRYYGRIPCLDYLAQVREAHPAFEKLGARVVAVGTGALFQARRLMED